jgi:hypothetical protein
MSRIMVDVRRALQSHHITDTLLSNYKPEQKVSCFNLDCFPSAFFESCIGDVLVECLWFSFPTMILYLQCIAVGTDWVTGYAHCFCAGRNYSDEN